MEPEAGLLVDALGGIEWQGKWELASKVDVILNPAGKIIMERQDKGLVFPNMVRSLRIVNVLCVSCAMGLFDYLTNFPDSYFCETTS